MMIMMIMGGGVGGYLFGRFHCHIRWQGDLLVRLHGRRRIILQKMVRTSCSKEEDACIAGGNTCTCTGTFLELDDARGRPF